MRRPMPPRVRRTLLISNPPMMLAASLIASVHIYHLGEAIKLGRLAWALPLSVVGYEIISSLVFFMTPEEYTDLRRAARTGFKIGLALSILLYLVFILVDEGVIPTGLVLRLLLGPIPSLVSAAFMHMLVLVYYAVSETAAADQAAQTVSAAAPEDLSEPDEALEAEPALETITTEETDDMEVRKVPVLQTNGSVLKATAPDGSERTIHVADHPELLGSVVEAEVVTEAEAATKPPTLRLRKDLAARAQAAAISATIPFYPESASEDSGDTSKRYRKPRVAEKHLATARKLMSEWVAAGNPPSKFRATAEVCSHFPGITDRQVRNVVRIVREEMEQQAEAVPA